MFYLDKLEFNNIREKLANFTYTIYGKELALNLEPSSSKINVKSMLDETKEAILASNLKGSFPLAKTEDVSLHIKRL